MIAVVSGTRPNVFAERFSRELSGLRAEPVVRAAGSELPRGRFDPPKAAEDPADRLNLRFKRSGAEER